jgi:hypothetical protein
LVGYLLSLDAVQESVEAAPVGDMKWAQRSPRQGKRASNHSIDPIGPGSHSLVVLLLDRVYAVLEPEEFARLGVPKSLVGQMVFPPALFLTSFRKS